MKNTIKAKIDSAKKFAHNHKTAIACTAGVVAGGTVVAVTIKKCNEYNQKHNSDLTVTPANALMMHLGAKGTYETPFGIITTMILPENRIKTQ